MKQTFLLLFLILSFYSFSQTLELSISENKTSFDVNTEVELILKLSNVETNLKNVSETNDIVFDFKELEKSIIVIGKTEGVREFGPYTVKIGNKILESNTLKIKFKNPKTKDSQTKEFIHIIAPDTVLKNKIFELTLLSNVDLTKPKQGGYFDNAENMPHKQFELNLDYNVEIINTSNSYSSQTKNGVSTSEFKCVIKLKGLEKGEMIINNDSFKPHLSHSFEQVIVLIK